jgi:membrane protein CcdC involved in cytochrome C biogenesis
MNINPIFIPILIAALVIWVIFRQLRARKVSRLQMILLPLIAAYEAFQTRPQVIEHQTWTEFAVTIMLAIAVGFGQAYTTRIMYKDGVLYTKGGAAYLILWIVLLAGRILIKLGFEGVDGLRNMHSKEWLIFAGIAIAWGLRSLLLYVRHPEIRAELGKSRRERA